MSPTLYDDTDDVLQQEEGVLASLAKDSTLLVSHSPITGLK